MLTEKRPRVAGRPHFLSKCPAFALEMRERKDKGVPHFSRLRSGPPDSRHRSASRFYAARPLPLLKSIIRGSTAHHNAHRLRRVLVSYSTRDRRFATF
jgi:hypothetical protein